MTDLLHMMHREDTIRVKPLRLQKKTPRLALFLIIYLCLIADFLINVLTTSFAKYENILGERDTLILLA